MTPSAYRALAIAWTLGILVAYSLPGNTLPSTPTLVGWDKAAHFILFAGFGFLWMRVLHPRGPDATRSTVPRRMITFLAIGLLLAVSGEIYQSLFPDRSTDPYDALANALGLFATVLLFRWRHPPRPQPREAAPS